MRTIALTLFLFLLPLYAGAEPTSLKLALFKSYIVTIKNSIGARAYRNFYYEFPNGRVMDVLQNGNLSCAYFVSSILFHFGLIGQLHIKVEDAVAAMKTAGWQIAESPAPGDVVVWGRMYFKKSNSWHMHIGFYIGRNRAISTSSQTGFPVIHHIRYRGRKIAEYLRHPALEEKKK